jgi:hypothetical protein
VAPLEQAALGRTAIVIARSEATKQPGVLGRAAKLDCLTRLMRVLSDTIALDHHVMPANERVKESRFVFGVKIRVARRAVKGLGWRRGEGGDLVERLMGF